MSQAKRVTTRTNLDPRLYVNIETGELMSTELMDEFGNTQVQQVKQNPDKIEIHYESYSNFNNDAIQWILNNLSNADVARLLQLIQHVRNPYNQIMKDKDTSHNMASLSVILGINESETRRFISRMKDKNVIAYVGTAKHFTYQKFFIVNPWITKKGKYVNSATYALFRNITEDLQ